MHWRTELKRFGLRFRLFFNPANARVTGQCLQCGNCCRQLYLRIGNKQLCTADDFKRLLKHNPMYQIFKIAGTDDEGELYFSCMALGDDNKCRIHKSRPGICRAFPSRTLKLQGGVLDRACGYKLVPIISFKEIFQQIFR
ncbi:MAG: YkgJ family cysteine cluster protein [Candidatus Cloacimonetes bacterium]|nr:YkgJ family cysteine cluster protein [Candidatus Cloacimonadota bacterium]